MEVTEGETGREEPARGASARWVYVAFFALAALAGPVNEYVSGAFLFAVHLQVLAGEALCAVLAGASLLALSAARRQKMLDSTQWSAVLLLLIPQWCAIPLSPLARPISWLHGIGWGAALLLSVAAPLWLGLAAALELVEVRVPRMVIGAAIAGVGAVCLVVPLGAYSIAVNQAPMLALQLLLNLAIVVSWVYAAPRLAGAGTLVVAGSYLLLSAVGDGAFSLAFQRGAWQLLDWGSAWAPLLAQAGVAAAIWWLWFWLLQRMTLAAFCMRSLAGWVAAMVPGFAMVGYLQWRMDVAVGIAFAAIVVALRSRVTEEQPTALGLDTT